MAVIMGLQLMFMSRTDLFQLQASPSMINSEAYWRLKERIDKQREAGVVNVPMSAQVQRSNDYNCTASGCYNSAICDSNSGQCNCTTPFTGDRCDKKTCGHGSGPDHQNVCSCEDGWSGFDCLACTNDAACARMFNATNSTETGYCDTTYITYKEKYFECVITDPLIFPLIGNITSMQCKNVSFDSPTGTCTFQSWAMDSNNQPWGYRAEVFYCTFFNCISKLYGEDPNKISYTCSRSECACTDISDRCEDPEIKYVIDHMKGQAYVECNNKTKACLMTHQDFPAEITLTCTGAECISQYVPPPPTPEDFTFYYKLAAGIGGGVLVSLIVIAMLISAIISICHTRHATKEYAKLYEYSLTIH
jgi:hypothetical protein